MPPLILLAVGVLGAAVAGRWLFKEARRVNAKLHPSAPSQPVGEGETIRKLERDPRTGVYRPK